MHALEQQLLKPATTGVWIGFLKEWSGPFHKMNISIGKLFYAIHIMKG